MYHTDTVEDQEAQRHTVDCERHRKKGAHNKNIVLATIRNSYICRAARRARARPGHSRNDSARRNVLGGQIKYCIALPTYRRLDLCHPTCGSAANRAPDRHHLLAAMLLSKEQSVAAVLGVATLFILRRAKRRAAALLASSTPWNRGEDWGRKRVEFVKAATHENLLIITDFDATITTGSSQQCHDILGESELLDSAFREEVSAPFRKFCMDACKLH
jgi:hypothetical protein